MSPEADQSTEDKQCAPNWKDTQKINKHRNIFFTTETHFCVRMQWTFSLKEDQLSRFTSRYWTDWSSWQLCLRRWQPTASRTVQLEAAKQDKNRRYGYLHLLPRLLLGISRFTAFPFSLSAVSEKHFLQFQNKRKSLKWEFICWFKWILQNGSIILKIKSAENFF